MGVHVEAVTENGKNDHEGEGLGGIVACVSEARRCMSAMISNTSAYLLANALEQSLHWNGRSSWSVAG